MLQLYVEGKDAKKGGNAATKTFKWKTDGSQKNYDDMKKSCQADGTPLGSG